MNTNTDPTRQPTAALHSTNAGPVLRHIDGRGAVYCSPWCGGGCTLAAHDRAEREAAELAARLGAGWEPVVWENLGWHYRVDRGPAQVTVDLRGSGISGEWEVRGYRAWLQNPDQQVISGAYPTPEEALAAMTREALARVGRLAADIADAAR